MAENNEPANPEPPASRPPAALPRRNISAERQAAASPHDPDDAMADFVDSVKVLAKHFTGEEVESAEPKDRSGRRVKKFQRSGLSDERPPLPAAAPAGGKPAASTAAKPVGPAPLPPPLPESEKADAVTTNKNIAWPRAGQAEAAEDEQAKPAPKPKRKKRNKTAVLAVVQGVGFGLLLLGFWLGRQTAPAADDEPTETRPAATPPTPGGSYRVSERALQVANEALSTARQGHVEEARKMFNDALATAPELPGVHYQLARLSLQTGDLLDADLHLDRSSDTGEFLAACCYSRARFAGMKGNYAEAVRQFQVAAHEEPFNGPNFFYWAEALRRQGQTLSAIGVFDQAIDRSHSTMDGVLYLFKQRLAKVEAGNDPAFNTELDAHLKQPNVSGEWLLLSAARDILRGAFPAAAETLKKAMLVLPPIDYDLAIKDYLFQSAATEPALTTLLQRPRVVDSTELNGPFVDPTVASPGLADPAIWQVATASRAPR